MLERKLPVIEVCGPTIQGEGPLIGRQTYFVRLGGCDYRCSWCDSLFAVLPDEVEKNSTKMTVAQIRKELAGLPGAAPWVTISGGNPCIFDLEELIHALRAFKRYKVAIETQATIRPPWLKYCDQIVLSPKPPSSGMETNWEHLGEFMSYSQAILKVVVFSKDDYHYAKQVHMLFPWVPFYISIGTSTSPWLSVSELRNDILDRLDCLVNLNFEDDVMRDVTILPQLHVLMYGHRRGV